MRSLPVPGMPGRRHREKAAFERLYAATAERIATAEDNLTKAQNRIDIIRAAPPWQWLPSKTKGDTP